MSGLELVASAVMLVQVLTWGGIMGTLSAIGPITYTDGQGGTTTDPTRGHVPVPR